LSSYEYFNERTEALNVRIEIQATYTEHYPRDFSLRQIC